MTCTSRDARAAGLLVILFAYLALPRIWATNSAPFAAGVIALSAFTAALIAEIVRAGILAVPTGIVEAAPRKGSAYVTGCA